MVAEVHGLEQQAWLQPICTDLSGIGRDARTATARTATARMPVVLDHMPAEVEHLVRARLVAAVEQERAHIARELHDVVGQALTAVRLSLLALGAAAAPDVERAARIWSSIAVVDAALNQVRTVAFDLRPGVLDDLGLPAALRTLCRSSARRSGVRISCRTDVGRWRLPPDVETTCFRIVQEALTNAIRHAGARHITVRVVARRRPRMLVLEVVDDGAGFDPSVCSGDRCLGIRGMHERASFVGGTIAVTSAQGRGTTVLAHLPAGAGGVWR